MGSQPGIGFECNRRRDVGSTPGRVIPKLVEFARREPPTNSCGCPRHSEQRCYRDRSQLSLKKINELFENGQAGLEPRRIGEKILDASGDGRSSTQPLSYPSLPFTSFLCDSSRPGKRGEFLNQ